jgi:hypothetical protein
LDRGVLFPCSGLECLVKVGALRVIEGLGFLLFLCRSVWILGLVNFEKGLFGSYKRLVFVVVVVVLMMIHGE